MIHPNDVFNVFQEHRNRAIVIPVGTAGRLWAEHSIEDLLQEMRAGRSSRREEQTVVQLGEAHSIVTPLTSFLVLESEQMFRDYRIERRSRALLE